MADIKIEIPPGAVAFRSQLGIKVKRPGVKRPIHEQRVGATYHSATKTWHQLVRVFDREGDRYLEIVTDADGRVVHRCEEPLSLHTGHGADKKKGGE